MLGKANREERPNRTTIDPNRIAKRTDGASRAPPDSAHIVSTKKALKQLKINPSSTSEYSNVFSLDESKPSAESFGGKLQDLRNVPRALELQRP